MLADHLRHADHVAKSIRIRKSKIKAAGGGAFLTIPVARGALLGFYKGSRVVVDNLVDEHGRADYIFQGESGGRDGYDPDGRLRLSDNEVVNVHSWSADDWAAMTDVDGVEWIGVTANWTRFCNHASKARNASVCTTSERFGRSAIRHTTPKPSPCRKNVSISQWRRDAQQTKVRPACGDCIGAERAEECTSSGAVAEEPSPPP